MFLKKVSGKRPPGYPRKTGLVMTYERSSELLRLGLLVGRDRPLAGLDWQLRNGAYPARQY